MEDWKIGRLEKKKPVIILGIESSCDETSAAVTSNCTILANLIANQKIHELYGGVVPELASRAHQKNIVPVVDEALKQAGIKKEELNAIAFTRGPGLIGSLLVGSSFAKAMALSLNIPLIEVNHMQAHVLAHFVGSNSKSQISNPKFPFLCLTVSGGHTQIILAKDFLDMKIIGETVDDAAGEAFDKAAKILGLPYPGGPLIDKYAQHGKPIFKFPEPNIPDLNFSFSGLKTSILYFVRDELKKDKSFIEKNLNNLCASIQSTIIKILIDKLISASKQTGIKEIAIAGGVAANSGLRNAIIEAGKKFHWNTYIPPFEFCTDNAAMIAVAGYFKYLKGEFAEQNVAASARYKF
ncbi:MAG: tRNA (adenosine(37)-N6)-threonylcarbamoyltransferase complex transferase subunit TsaD [Bacteroidetes bacterium]|nr:tRNA (adenosine(37)-N6)-threonylcarbamoyltransferase complex transferase subunit TsaD [Bacteroidota bacterium]